MVIYVLVEMVNCSLLILLYLYLVGYNQVNFTKSVPLIRLRNRILLGY